MSGHSKWANIKHRKASSDAKKGKVFTKHAKLIAIAAKNGGEPEMNPLLRTAIDNARAMNMPRENIERAIKKGTGELKGEKAPEEVIYDAFGPGGIALYIQTLTDNRNRTLGNLKIILNKNGGNLGEAGSVGWMFKKVGLISVNLSEEIPGKEHNSHSKSGNFLQKDAQGQSVEEIELIAIDKGAIDVKTETEYLEIYTEANDLMRVKTELLKENVPINSAEITYTASNLINIEENSEDFDKLIKLLDILEEDEDVSTVFSNANFINS